MDLLANISSFLIHFIECFLAIFVYELIKDHADRHISFFQFMTNADCYYLSFIYKECRDLRLKGMSIPEIQAAILKKFDERSFGFLFYPITKKKNLEAVSLARASVEDLTLFEKYVCTPEFGKSSVKELKRLLTHNNGNDDHKDTDKEDDEPAPAAKLTSDNGTSSNKDFQEHTESSTDLSSPSASDTKPVVKLPISEDERDTLFAVMDMLLDDSPECASRAMLWFRDKLCHPIKDPDDNSRSIKDGENGASLYFALIPTKDKSIREENVVYHFKYKTYQYFIDFVKKLKKVYPEMNDIDFNHKSAISDNFPKVNNHQSRLAAIREDFEKNVLQLSK